MKARTKVIHSVFLSIIMTVAIIGFLIPQTQAATLFSDGFESGTFDYWYDTYNKTGCSLDVVSDETHHGVYSAKAITNLDSDYSRTDVVFDDSPTTLYIQAYFRFVNLPSAGTNRVEFLQISSGATTIAVLMIRIEGGILKLRLSRYYPTFLATAAVYAFVVDTWYALGLKYVKGSSGEYRAYVNGVETITDLPDTSTAPDLNKVRLGVTNTVGEGFTLYYDCAVMSTTSISIETTSPIYSNIVCNTNMAGKTATFTCVWAASPARLLVSGILSHNIAGAWANQTTQSLSGITATFSDTATLPSTIGIVVQYKFYASDNASEWTMTPTQSITTSNATYRLRFSTSFENVTVGSETLTGLGIANYVYVANGGTCTLDSTFARTNSKSILCTTPAATTANMRSELQITHLDDTSLHFDTREIYVSTWLYLPSDWSLTKAGYNWYEIINPWLCYGSEFYPRMVLHIHRPNYPTSQAYNLQLEYHTYRGTGWTVGVIDDFVVPRGVWFNVRWWLYLSYTDGKVKLWIDTPEYPDYLLANATGLRLQNTASDLRFYFAYGKNYMDGDNQVHNIWTDDLEIWDGIPSTEEEDTTPPTISNIAHNTTIANTPCEFSSRWQDSEAVSGFIFSWNGTGGWTNDTWADLFGTIDWANNTETLPALGTIVGYRWYCNDTSDNWAASNIYSFTTTSTGENVVVLLNYPTDGSYPLTLTKNVTFQFTPIFYQTVENASVWTNVTGSWALTISNSSIITNNTLNSISYTFAGSGYYIWNVAVYNSTTHVFAQQNRTLWIHLEPYLVSTSYGTIAAECESGLSGSWRDDDGMSGYIFSWNGTGVWTNTTWATLNSSISAGISVTETLPSIANAYVSFRFYVNDTDDLWEASSVTTFQLSFFNSQALIDYNDGLQSSGLPYLQSATHIVSTLSLSGEILTYTINASVGLTSTTNVYATSYGEPTVVNGVTSWAYDPLTTILTLNRIHSSPAFITVIWSTTAPGAAGEAATGLSGFLLFLAEGDWLGFLQAIFVASFMSADLFYGFIILLFMAPIYIRTRSLILVCILWILIGSGLIVAAPMVAALGIAFMALGIAGVLVKIFTSLR